MWPQVPLQLARLTKREVEVLAHVIAGQLNKEIAFELGIAEATVKIRHGRIMKKLQVQSLAEGFGFESSGMNCQAHKP